MIRVGIIARADATGLGIQSRNWVRLLNPDKVIVINSRPFNGNDQHMEWYAGRRNAFRIDGFIKQNEINPILDNIDVLLTFEIPYNYSLLNVARARGIKVIIQNNWEFTDYLRQPELPLPDILLNHSYWHLKDQEKLWPNITEYSPTPIFIEDYAIIREQNRAKFGKPRFLHIAGRQTYEDRNGTLDLIEAIKLIPPEVEFELVIKSQTTNIPHIDDDRVVVSGDAPADEKELYRWYDAVIMPRRYGGACLPMNEALAAGLPVIMTDIDPNNKILPSYWLVPAYKKTQFMARTMIDVFSADHVALAGRIAQFAVLSDKMRVGYKDMALEIAEREYSPDSVKHKWSLLMDKLGL